jgi:demethylmenaquinone methyltransferase/2-methoxy-6-polyprenyl-1,4-benzoquinol methylase
MNRLRSEIATPEGKRRYVRRLFATIANRYDFITRFLSFGQDQRWKRRLIELAKIGPSDRVLDLACGTGDITEMAARRARSAIGLDVTLRMLQLAAVRSRGPQAASAKASAPKGSALHQPENPRRRGSGADLHGPRISLICGDMLALPFPAGQFDVVTIGYGLRNVPDLAGGIHEIHRALAPGGRMLSLDFNRPEHAIVRAVYLAYLTVVGSALGWMLHGDPDTYRYIPESIRNYPGAHGVARLLEQQGFTNVRALPVLGGFMSIHVAEKRQASARDARGEPNLEHEHELRTENPEV